MQYLQTLNDYMGVEPTGFILNEEMHRFGKKKEYWARGSTWIYKDKAYWKVTYGNWSLDEKKIVTSYGGTKLTPNESRSITANSQALNLKVEQQKQRKYKEAREIWGPVFKTLKQGSVHEYMVNKGFESNATARLCSDSFPELHLYADTLCIPVYNGKGQLTGLQRIYKDKQGGFEKRYTPGLELVGSICPIVPFRDAPLVYLAEGFATACSIHHATAAPAIACFQANNIEASIKTIRFINPECSIVICADRDLKIDIKTGKPSNIGELKAKAAAANFDNCLVRTVEFPEGSPEHWSDFNDLHCFKDLASVTSQLLIKDKKVNRFTQDLEIGFTKEDEETGKPIRQYTRLMEYMVEVHKVKYISGWNRFVVWRDNHYQSIEDEAVRAFAQKYFKYPTCISNKERAEFVGLVKSSTITDSSFFDSSKLEGLINLKNGVYRISDAKLLPHSPEIPFQFIIDTNYELNALCPTWNELVDNMFLGRAPIIDVIHEFIGLIISGIDNSMYNEILILFGAGANGKSTLINAIENLVGRSNSSAVSIESLSRTNFGTGSMRNKLVNFSEEESKKVFSDTGLLKKISGGSPIQTEEKNKQSILTPLTCKTIMSYNEMPFLSDLSKGMLRRLLIVPCDLDLEASPDKKIENVKKRLEGESEGLLLLALSGLNRLLSNDGFTVYAERKEAVQELVNSSDSFHEFIEEEYIITGNSEDFESTINIIGAFSLSLGDEHKSKLTPHGAIKKLKAIYMEHGVTFKDKVRRTIRGNTLRGVEGIKRKEWH